MSTQTKTSMGTRVLESFLKVIACGAVAILLALVIAMAMGTFPRSPAPITPAMIGLGPGETAPAIAASAWINGQPTGLGEKPILLQAWFYNCPYCWREAPHITELSEKYGGQVDFVALSPDPVSKKDLVQDFVRENDIAYPVGYGAFRTLFAFNVRAYPALFLIGTDGTILWNSGQAMQQPVEEAIQQALSSEA